MKHGLSFPLVAGVLAIALHIAAPAPLAAQATGSASADLPIVAVYDFEGFMMSQAGNSPYIGKAVSGMVITELLLHGGVRVVERAQLQDVMREQGLSLSARVDDETAVRIGRMLGARYIIRGGATSDMTDLRIEARAIDTETSEVLRETVVKLRDRQTNLLDMVVTFTDTFAGRLNLEPPSARPAMEEIPVMSTIEYSRAMNYEDQGDRQKAMEHYRAALQLHPAHSGAKAALARLESGGNDR